MLAGFWIGADAQSFKFSILTRDFWRFPRYFPDINLITPETHP
jgi:hypothetical protein